MVPEKNVQAGQNFGCVLAAILRVRPGAYTPAETNTKGTASEPNLNKRNGEKKHHRYKLRTRDTVARTSDLTTKRVLGFR